MYGRISEVFTIIEDFAMTLRVSILYHLMAFVCVVLWQTFCFLLILLIFKILSLDEYLLSFDDI